MIQRMTCPVCKKPLPDDISEARRTMPFCSNRCRQVDLFRWAEGRYAVVEQLDLQDVEILQMDPDIEVVDETPTEHGSRRKKL